MLITIRDKRISHIIMAVLLCTLWSALGLAYYYFSSISYPRLGLALFIIYSLVAGVASGLLATLLRVFNVIGNTSFFYHLIGTANILLGIVGVLIMLFSEMETVWLILFVSGWIWGVFVLQDTFSKPSNSA